jgi:NADPH:quinone reductase-like Zn-dependent oxidoreductase
VTRPGSTDGRLLGGSDRGIRAKLLSLFVGQQMGTFVASEKTADLSALTELIEAGQLTPAIDRTYPLSEVAAAIRHLLDGKTRGTIAVSVSPGRMPTPATGSTP